ncbi:DUF2254 domain-containing protein [Streptomyces ficellus]|uniref:DUF2254 domain-containing protein n=2 Tax=Streptomyces ficellus TaxID=1977088 RepID=A0ABT7Z3E4_9ACTN|nr:DUF2254 domain-containing protein [Streptomyces ficellus]MDN3293995.1 DUF2254 domain-containing protein [Streptomyces ficellus]
MVSLPGRRTPRAEGSRSPLWLPPTVGGVVAFAAALLLARVRPAPGSPAAGLWPGDVNSAATALQAVATTSVTVTTLTFSLTVVTLQLASQQFSPRLLRRYARDTAAKSVLTVLTCAFVFTITTLSFLDTKNPVPGLALVTSMVLGVASLAAVLAYLTHIVREVRVDSMMQGVHQETATAIGIFYPAHDDPRPHSPDEMELDEAAGVTVYATDSGFVRLVDVHALVECARRRGALVRLNTRPGDLVIARSPLATVWARAQGAGPPEPEADGTAAEINAAVTLGYERTLDQDVAFGFRQLEDIAVKAMSPGINDPVTAAAAVGHMADLLVRLADCRLGPIVHVDGDGEPRAIVPDRDMRYYLDLACGQLKRFASREPTVLAALLRMLRDLAVVVHDREHVDEVRRAADAVRNALSPAVSEADAEQVHDLHRRVLIALEGHAMRAYGDRSGETRSV